MIFDTIENYKLYTKLSPQIAKALKLAAETDFENMPDGKYPVDSDKLYYLVQRYQTKSPAEKLEAHKKYIDIQFIAQGTEQIGCAATNYLSLHTPYSEEKDVEFYHADNRKTLLNMTKGDFVIFWPTDAHMPGYQVNKPEDVLKIVFKIRV
jgi:YhcH/YjgK/YiaL family protein